jgi:hypothetical protein
MDTFTHAALFFVLVFYGILLVVGPIVLRIQFRYRANVEPRVVAFGDLPAEVREYIEPRVATFALWNFDLIAYLNLGRIAARTESFMALLSNPHTAEWAGITFVISRTKKTRFMEFMTRRSEEMQIDTSTDSTAPVLFPLPQHHVFRFPQIQDVYTLYRVHRMLVNEITRGALPVLPPPGQELVELKRRLDRYGPWQQEHGYMYLDAKGENYRLTWKGAILGAWRAVWPVPLVRGWRMQKENQTVLNRIGVAT